VGWVSGGGVAGAQALKRSKQQVIRAKILFIVIGVILFFIFLI
jgi:hypothetical protein